MPALAKYLRPLAYTYITSVVLIRAACGSNILTRTYTTCTFLFSIQSLISNACHSLCRVTRGFHILCQIMVTLLSYISNACHSLSGVAERLQHTYQHHHHQQKGGAGRHTIRRPGFANNAFLNLKFSRGSRVAQNAIQGLRKSSHRSLHSILCAPCGGQGVYKTCCPVFVVCRSTDPSGRLSFEIRLHAVASAWSPIHPFRLLWWGAVSPARSQLYLQTLQNAILASDACNLAWS